jgi:hypothetical protein
MRFPDGLCVLPPGTAEGSEPGASGDLGDADEAVSSSVDLKASRQACHFAPASLQPTANTRILKMEPAVPVTTHAALARPPVHDLA